MTIGMSLVTRRAAIAVAVGLVTITSTRCLHEFRGQGFSTLRVALRVAHLYEDVAADYPPALAQGHDQRVSEVRRRSGHENPYSVDALGHLCTSVRRGERRGEGAGQRGQQEAAAVHGGMVERGLAKTGTLHDHPNSAISASAFSLQYVMLISRYIVVAVVRCSCAGSRLSVRR